MAVHWYLYHARYQKGQYACITREDLGSTSLTGPVMSDQMLIASERAATEITL